MVHEMRQGHFKVRRSKDKVQAYRSNAKVQASMAKASGSKAQALPKTLITFGVKIPLTMTYAEEKKGKRNIVGISRGYIFPSTDKDTIDKDSTDEDTIHESYSPKSKVSDVIEVMHLQQAFALLQAIAFVASICNLHLLCCKLLHLLCICSKHLQ
ncbi:hypothetical protein Tco_0528438 [Tanacetum coccineum]